LIIGIAAKNLRQSQNLSAGYIQGLIHSVQRFSVQKSEVYGFRNLLNLFYLFYWLNWLAQTEPIEQIKPIKPMNLIKLPQIPLTSPFDCERQPMSHELNARHQTPEA
jgi:hypothetical protein